MEYEQLNNCYQTVLEQRNEAEFKLGELVSLLNARVGDMDEDMKHEFITKLNDLDL